MTGDNTPHGERAQIFTLEGVLAALVVVGGLVFAMQIVVLTPSTSGDTANPVRSGELDSVLETTAESGGLKKSVLYWNPEFDDSGGGGPVNLNGFHNTSNRSQFYNGTEFNESQGLLAPILGDTLDDSMSLNVVIHYRNETGHVNGTFPMVFNGAPGSDAVRSSTSVVIYDSDPLIEDAPDYEASSTTVVDAESAPDQVFYAPDAYPDSELYNVFEVEVIVWQR